MSKRLTLGVFCAAMAIVLLVPASAKAQRDSDFRFRNVVNDPPEGTAAAPTAPVVPIVIDVLSVRMLGEVEIGGSGDSLGEQLLSLLKADDENGPGSFGDLVKAIESARAAGEDGRVDYFRAKMSTINELPAFVQTGRRQSRVAAMQTTSSGRSTSSVVMENVGRIVNVTPRIQGDSILLNIKIESSELDEHGSVVIGEMDGEEVRSPAIRIAVVESNVLVRNGEFAVVAGEDSVEPNARMPVQTALLVLAEAVEEAPMSSRD